MKPAQHPYAVVTLLVAIGCPSPDDQALGSGPTSTGHDTTGEGVPSSSSDDGSVERAPECRESFDCPPGVDCVDGRCSNDPCPTGCCPPACCESDCPANCVSDDHCRSNERCAAGACLPAATVCSTSPIFDVSTDSTWTALAPSRSIAAAHTDADTERELLLGTSDGLLWVDRELGVMPIGGGEYGSLVVHDLDGDGDDDLVARRDDTATLEVVLRTATGWALGTSVAAPSEQHVLGRIVAADDWVDLAWVDVTSGTPRAFVAAGNGDGTFDTAVELEVSLDLPWLGIADSWVGLDDQNLFVHVAGGIMVMQPDDDGALEPFQQIDDEVAEPPTLGLAAARFLGSRRDVLTFHPLAGTTVVHVVTGQSPTVFVPLEAHAVAVDDDHPVVVAGEEYVGLVQGGESPCYAVVGVPVSATVAAIADVDGDGAFDLVLSDAERTHVLLQRSR